MRSKGASEAAIYAATNKALDGTPYAGISYDAASKPRFEISDHDAKLVPSGLDASGRGTMGGFLRHPELYKALPSAERLSVNKGGIQGNAAFDGKTVHLGDRNFADQMLAGRPRARQTVRGPLLHELQHHGQDAGDRPRGASPNDFRAQHPGDSFEAKTRRHIQYGRVAGEVESEVTRLSANMTPAERRAEHPNARAKRFGLADRRDQIVMDSHGRIVEMANATDIHDAMKQATEARPVPDVPGKGPAAEHRYAMQYRPPGSSTLPDGLKWDYAELPKDFAGNRPDLQTSKDHRFGVIKTDRPLTADEMRAFEIKPLAGSNVGTGDTPAGAMANAGSTIVADPQLSKPRWGSFGEMVADTKRTHAFAEQAIAEELAKPMPRLSVEKNGLTSVLTKMPDGQGIRVTTLRDGEPLGHREYDTTAKGLADARQDMVSGGLKPPPGWSDEAREASAEVRAANARPEVEAKPVGGTDTESLAKARGIRERIQGSIKGSPEHSAALKDWSALPIETQRAAAQTGAPASPAGTASVKASVEVRDLGKSRFGVVANGQPVKDSKGNDKWFGSRSKAEAFAAKQSSVTPPVTNVTRETGKTVSDQGSRAPSVTRNAAMRDPNRPIELHESTRRSLNSTAAGRRTLEKLGHTPEDPRAAERARIANGTKRIGDTYKAPAPTEPSKAETFASSLKPMTAAKVKAALETQVRHNGKEFLTRAALVERQIAEGAAVQTMKIGGKEQRVLMGKDGAFLDQRAITKAGLDYAEHLSGLRGTQNPNNLAVINENRAANAQPDKSSPAGQKAMWADADRKSRELMRQFSDTQRSDNPLTDAERTKLADKRPQYEFMRPKDAKGNVYETLDDRRQRIVAPNGETVGYTERKQPLKRAVTLGDGRRVGLGQYVGAWKKALAMDPNAPVAGTPSAPRGGGTAGDAVAEFREGMQDRINKHDPAFGKGRKWDSTWQRDARRLRDTLTRKSEVPKGEAHPVDLRPKLAAMGKLEPGTYVPPKGGDRSKAAQAARNPRYIPGVGVPQQPGMTYKAPPTPTVADLPKGAFKGSEKDFSSLSPGMRREIARTAEKLAAKPRTPQVAPLKGMGPIGFQNEATLNAALKAQGKAKSGEAKPVESAPKAKVAAPKPPKGFDPKRAGMRFLGTSSTMERGPVGVFLGKDGTAYVADAKAAMDTDGRPLGLRQAPAGIQMSAAKAAKDHRFHASAQKAPEDSLARDFKPAAPTVSDLKAEAKAAGIKGASKMTKASLMEALGKNVNRIGMVGMIAAPVAAAMVAYDATKSSAHAAGTDGKTATMQAATAAAVAGGVTAGIGYGIGKGIGLTFKAAAAIAPKVAPMLGPAGVALGVGMMGYGAYHGYQKGGFKGAALGAIGADSLLDLGKSAPVTPTAAPEGAPRGVDATKASEFEARNTAYSAMQETARNVVEVNTFARERHTESGTVVKEVVKAYTRARPNQ